MVMDCGGSDGGDGNGDGDGDGGGDGVGHLNQALVIGNHQSLH